MRTGLISIHEEFAEAIFRGEKRYEFRTRAPILDGPTRFQVYVPGKKKALVGDITVGEILEDSPEALWQRTKGAAKIDKERFFTYFQGREKAYALVITKHRRYHQVLSLATLRAMLPGGFTPPQFMKWLSKPIERVS